MHFDVSLMGWTVLATITTVKVTIHKFWPFDHAVSMSKWPSGSVGNIVYYLTYLPDPFPRGLKVDLEGSSTFPLLALSMHINRLGLFWHLQWYLLGYITTWQGSWAGATALHMEVVWCYTIDVSVWCSMHKLAGCECAVKVSCTSLGCIYTVCMGIYCYIQLYIHAYNSINILKIHI